MEQILIIIIVALKYLSPFLLPFFPFGVGWFNFVLDTVDGDLLIPMGLDSDTYQLIDKSADYVTYIMMVVAAYKWRIKKEIIITFALRTIGQILFFLTKNEIYFFYFPNLLEPLFLIYATILHFKKDEEKTYKVYKKYWILIWAFILVYKFQDEYITHVGNIDRSTLVKDTWSKIKGS